MTRPPLPLAGRHAGATDRDRELARRREVLLGRSTRLREELRTDVHTAHRQLGTVGRSVQLARSRWLVPLAVAGGAMFLFRRPSRALRMAGRLIAFWPVVRPLVPRVAALLAAARRST